MSNRVVIQEGYTMPVAFDGVRRRRSSGKKKQSGAFKSQQNKMKSCAKKWNGKGKYSSHMKQCLKK